jgi:hypothetical protein
VERPFLPSLTEQFSSKASVVNMQHFPRKHPEPPVC